MTPSQISKSMKGVSILDTWLMQIHGYMRMWMRRPRRVYRRIILQELSFISTRLSVGSLSPWFFIGYYAFNITNSFPLVVHAQRSCLPLNKEQPILIHLGPNSIQHLLAYQNEFEPIWTNIECLFKPPHYLQACTANLSNREVLYSSQSTPNQKACSVRGWL